MQVEFVAAHPQAYLPERIFPFQYMSKDENGRGFYQLVIDDIIHVVPSSVVSRKQHHSPIHSLQRQL
jgi:hypothetical protein